MPITRILLMAMVLSLLLMLWPGTSQAADSITIDLGGTPVVLSVNAANKDLLTRLLGKENARRATQSPPLSALTLEQYSRDLMVDMFRGYKIQYAGEEYIDACTTFKALLAADQQSILTLLGGMNPCS